MLSEYFIIESNMFILMNIVRVYMAVNTPCIASAIGKSYLAFII
ncbi:hypothetical protein YPPY101_3321 [Yersinia pestis PY-101]|nr:hypothetical protein YPPY101_3321 [Yersinia pestis PY-101]